MQSKLSLICDRVIEAGWLAAAVFTPLYFNVYSSRVFEPDKISLLRNIVLMMTLAWAIKLIESALTPKSGRALDTLEEAAPGWLPRLLRVPMMIPLVLYAAVYLLSTVTSVVPLTAFFGSYQRFQGLISQYTYVMLALMILANLRTRAQLNRLITFAIATSVPVAAYGLLQRAGMDPLPWAGDVQTRVASSLGNAIFVGAYLLMIVPLTLQRLVAVIAAWRGSAEAAPSRERTADPWPLAVIGGGAVFLLILIQYAAMVSGNLIDGSLIQQDFQPAGEFFAWAVVLLAAFGFVWLAARMAPTLGITTVPVGPDEADPNAPPPVLLGLLPLVQVAVIWVGIRVIGATQVPDFRLWILYPAAIFIFYILTFLYTLTARSSRAGLALQLVGLPILLVMQVVVVFLTQSRGPELGLLTGLAVFAFAYLLRRRLYRAFTVATVLAVLFIGFLVVFNLPNSPIASWRTLPYVGRLGLISQLDEGTGKVRTLIWSGAANLIKSDPVRMVIGWGPEAMYVAYNRFYPPDLAHWELRNATPDRSHDVFFDQAVTLGLLGLAAYLFLIGSFVWVAVRAIRRATRLPDQLLLIGFLAVVLAHVVEAAVGIEIAATYTYVYIAIAGVVVLGYVLNPAARPAPVAAPLVTEDQATVMLPDLPLATTGNGHSKQPAAEADRIAAGEPAGRTATLPVAKGQAGGNGNGNGTTRRPLPPSGRNIPPVRGSAGNVRPDGRALGGGGRAASRLVAVAPGSYAERQPLFLAAYVGLALLALALVVGLNVNAVKADMFYKQGLSYDNQQAWPGSVGPYRKAISLSPNEDFYYLFLGRAYMEWARNARSFAQVPGSNNPVALLQEAEKQLLAAKTLNPLNTDHYANIGRLYLYWADVMSDPNSGVKGTPQSQAQRYDQGVAMYEIAHNLSPGNAEVWNELALAYAKAGRPQDAIAAIHGSQQMDDRYARTPYVAGEIERSYAQSLAQLATSQTISATTVLSATTQAGASAHDYALAAHLDPTLLQDSSFDTRLNFLQQYKLLPVLAAGYQKVIDDALAAKAQDPSSPDESVEARAALGYINQRLSQAPEAIKQFERAVYLQCDNFDNLKALGMLYQSSGQDDKALNILQGAQAVADCSPAAPYSQTCAALKTSVAKGTCSALTARGDMTSTLTLLNTTVAGLKTKLGR